MPQNKKTLIMKFGGAATKTPESFSQIAQIIINRFCEFQRILIVVSAMGDMTDKLISLAYQVHPSPPKREYDMLVSVGERISSALLAMALANKGVEAVSFTGSQSGIITSKEHSDARIVDVRPTRILPFLEAKKIVIVAGFQGVSTEKEITTLGRGGSDTTAVALGVALNAEQVEFYKEFPGIFEKDPKTALNPSIYKKLSYKHASTIIAETGGQVLHLRALSLAQKNHLPLHVLSFREKDKLGTIICSETSKAIEPIYEENLSTNHH